MERHRYVTWAGRIAWILSVPLLAFDAVIHLWMPKPVIDSFEKLELPVSIATGLGVLMVALIALYSVPRTAVLGAVLLTGYLGGAVLTHLRVGEPFYFPIIIGALLWGSLYCRDDRVAKLWEAK